MTAMNQTVTPTSTFTSKTLVRMLLGALIGAVVGYGGVTLISKLGVSVKMLSWSDLLAIWLGIVFVAFGLVFGYLAVNRKQLAKALEGPSAEPGERMPATADEVRIALLQAVVLALAGILLLMPILALGPMRTNPWIAGWVYGGIVVLFGIQTVCNIELWRKSDEVVRRALLIVSAGTFAGGQAILFLWAAAERLHLVNTISSWDIFALLMTMYLLMSAGVSIRLRR